LIDRVGFSICRQRFTMAVMTSLCA